MDKATALIHINKELARKLKIVAVIKDVSMVSIINELTEKWINENKGNIDV